MNKKQKRVALECAIAEKANNGKLFVMDAINVESGKTKDAAAMVKALAVRDALVIKEQMDEKSFLAFRNLPNAYLIEPNELNAFTATAFDAIVIEKSVYEQLTKEG